MTAEQIDNLARKRELLPDNALQCDYVLYHSLVCLYREYRDGIFNADTAKKEKNRLFGKHKDLAQMERIFREDSRRMTEISGVMVRVNKEGCPLCREVARLFDGRQRCADKGVEEIADG